MIDDEEAYDVATLAKRWKISTRQVYTLIKSGELRAFKIGKRGLRVEAGEARRWRSENGGQPASGTVIAPSSGEASRRPLPVSRMKALVSAKG